MNKRMPKDKTGDLKKKLLPDHFSSLEAYFLLPPPLGVGASLENNAVEGKHRLLSTSNITTTTKL